MIIPMTRLGFVDLTELPDLMSEPKPGVLLSILHTNGEWRPHFLKSITPVDEYGFETWCIQNLWVIPQHAWRHENASCDVGEGHVARQYRASTTDIENARDMQTGQQMIRVRIEDGHIYSPKAVRVIVGVGYHQRIEETLNRRSTPIVGLPIDEEAVRNEQWFHATFSSDWDKKILDREIPLMIHIGTEFAAGARVFDIGKTQRLRRGTDFYVHRLELKPEARLSCRAIRDLNDWTDNWDENYHGNFDAFVYVNDYEQKGSSSLYVRADMVNIVKSETYQFYPEGMRWMRDVGTSDNQILNTSRIRARTTA